MANRVRALASRIYTFGMSQGLLEANPIAATSPPGVERPRDRWLNDSEIRYLWREWAREGSPVSRAFRALLVTGQRIGEVAGMRRSEISEGWWSLDGSRTKSGRRQRVPVTPLLEELVASSPPGDWVFQKRGGDGPITATHSPATRRYSERSGVKKWSPHTLRHTVKTQMLRLQVPPHVTEIVLNHARSRGGVSARYDHYSYERELIEAMTTWDDHLCSILER